MEIRLEDFPVTFSCTYTNYRGETKQRRIHPKKFVFEATVYHPVAQWIMYGIDLDTREERGFAMCDMRDVVPL